MFSLPEDFQAKLETGTVNGGFDTDIPITIQGRFRTRHVITELNGGGPPVRLVTTNGGTPSSLKSRPRLKLPFRRDDPGTGRIGTVLSRCPESVAGRSAVRRGIPIPDGANIEWGLGRLKRECLNHFIFLSEDHLRRNAYVSAEPGWREG